MKTLLTLLVLAAFLVPASLARGAPLQVAPQSPAAAIADLDVEIDADVRIGRVRLVFLDVGAGTIVLEGEHAAEAAAVLADSETPTVKNSWTHKGMLIEVETPKKSGESTGNWLARHQYHVDEFAKAWPPDADPPQPSN